MVQCSTMLLGNSIWSCDFHSLELKNVTLLTLTNFSSWISTWRLNVHTFVNTPLDSPHIEKGFALSWCTYGNHLVPLFLPLLLVQQKGLKIALVVSVDWNTLEVWCQCHDGPPKEAILKHQLHDINIYMISRTLNLFWSTELNPMWDQISVHYNNANPLPIHNRWCCCQLGHTTVFIFGANERP